MKKLRPAMHGLLVCLVGLTPALLWAAPPNVVLSRALNFSSSDGTSVTLGPGKYFIEQAGPSEIRVTPAEGDKPVITIQAKPLSHEQYELFSPMALTRPQKDDEYLIELLLPGGIRLVARGSTKAPAEHPKITRDPTSAAQPQTVQEPEIIVSTPSPPSILPQPPQEELSPALPSPPESPSLGTTLRYQTPVFPSQGTRVVVDKHEPGQESLYLSVLSPDHIGLTMFEQPALFWFIAQLTSHPVDVMITDEGNSQRLLDVRMLPPIRPGIHKVELKDYGIRLQPNTAYQWKIILQGDSPGERYTTSGWIMRVSPPGNMPALTHLPSINSTQPQSLVEAGLWYDAVWALSERIQSTPTDSTSLKQRADLFEQVGLLPPAQQDRAHLLAP